jgi:hypothetical protein
MPGALPGPGAPPGAQAPCPGQRARILKNELYIGRLVWNRQRYVKEPETGKRLARINPAAAWIVTDVPHLRILDDARSTSSPV